VNGSLGRLIIVGRHATLQRTTSSHTERFATPPLLFVKKALELLGIVVDTRRQLYLLSPEKLRKISQLTRILRQDCIRRNDNVPSVKFKNLWPEKLRESRSHQRSTVPACSVQPCRMHLCRTTVWYTELVSLTRAKGDITGL
jgi:hypothetical protein